MSLLGYIFTLTAYLAFSDLLRRVGQDPSNLNVDTLNICDALGKNIPVIVQLCLAFSPF